MAANPMLAVSVQAADFDTGQLQAALRGGAAREGAVATFTGFVRADNERHTVTRMILEHYPGMTEKSIAAILQQAATRWTLLAASVVHRVGELLPGEQIVWVGVASAHREDAFAACEFVMDYLKTSAPFWKKECGPAGARWVEPRATDTLRMDRWQEASPSPE